MSANWRAFTFFVMLSSVAAAASADPLKVNFGQFTIDHEGDFFRFHGEGFSVGHDTPRPENYGLWVPKDWNATCFVSMSDETCTPGEVFDLSFTTPDDAFLGYGEITRDGVTYEDVMLRGAMDFRVQPLVLPPTAEGFVSMHLPFTFSGTIRASRDGLVLASLPLAGSGLARAPLYFERGLYFGEDGRVDYVFEDVAPTPEPGTWLLLTTGAFGLAARLRQRRLHGMLGKTKD